MKRRQRQKRGDSIQRILMMSGWRVLSKSRGHITVTPSPPLIAESSCRRYELDRNDEGQWYSVYADPKHGRCIDERVPDGESTTLRTALRDLIEHVTDRVVRQGLNEDGTKEHR